MSPLEQYGATLSPQQRRLLKFLFIILAGLAFMDAWIWYLLWERENLFFILFVFGYFYFCNFATNIREALMWPFYFRSNKTE